MRREEGREDEAIMKIVSIAGFLLMAGALVLLLSAHALLGETAVPIAVQVAAFGLMIWARLAFGRRSFHASADPTEGGVVTSGPYRYLRHPIYAAVLYFTLAGVLSHLSAVNAALGACVAAGAAMRIFTEERLLVERYPEYGDYASRTRRVIPFIL